MDPLLSYLDNNLATLTDSLYPSVFRTILKMLWKAVINKIVDEALLPEQKVEPITIRKSTLIMESLEILRQFFYADGNGLDKASLTERISFIKRLVELHQAPNSTLMEWVKKNETGDNSQQDVVTVQQVLYILHMRKDLKK